MPVDLSRTESSSGLVPSPPNEWTARQPISFPQWQSVLAATDWNPADRERVRRHVVAFLHECKVQRRPVTGAGVKAYLQAIDAEAPRAVARESLAWFYTRGQHRPVWPAGVEAVALPERAGGGAGSPRRHYRQDHPGPAAGDRGGADWERDLIRAVRERGLLWRTERRVNAAPRGFGEAVHQSE